MENVNLKRIKTQKKSDTAYNVLYEKIISKSFSPGQRLDLVFIETQLGISRMPLRLALTRLEHEGLVEIVPQSGTFITNPSSKHLADSFDMRVVLECYAIDLAISLITEKDILKLRSFIGEMEGLIKSDNWGLIYQNYIEIDTKFHKELAVIAGNKRLIKAIDQENTHLQGSRKLLDYLKDDLEVTINEHKQILSYIMERDVEEARKAMSHHLRRVKMSLLNILDSN